MLQIGNSDLPQKSGFFCASNYHLATPAIAELAIRESIYKGQKFSDHAPLTIEYDFKL